MGVRVHVLDRVVKSLEIKRVSRPCRYQCRSLICSGERAVAPETNSVTDTFVRIKNIEYPITPWPALEKYRVTARIPRTRTRKRICRQKENSDRRFCDSWEKNAYAERTECYRRSHP